MYTIVILTTNIKKLGKIGDLVNVKDGFAEIISSQINTLKKIKNLEHYENIEDEMNKNEKIKLDNAKNRLTIFQILKLYLQKLMKRSIIWINFKRNYRFLESNNIKVKSDDLMKERPIKSIGKTK